MMSIAEQIYQIAQALPQEQASEILTFAEFIRAKHLNPHQSVITVASNGAKSGSFQSSLKRLHDLTQDVAMVDPVALIQLGREELDERG